MDYLNVGFLLRNDRNISNYAYHLAHLKNH